MSQYKITFLPDNIVVEAQAGENLIDVASKASLHINASCGGAGVCGRCRVELVAGQVDAQSDPGAFLSPEECEKGVRLACCCQVNGDATINIPPESRADATVYATSLTEVAVEIPTPQPMTTLVPFELTPPSVGDNQGDYDRLRDYLATQAGFEQSEIGLDALWELPGALRNGDFKATMTVFEEAEGQAKRILDFLPGHKPERLYGLAIDIGTTTVWARLVNLQSGESGATYGDLNGQISFGEDVISRIVFAGKGDGLERLKERVTANINHLIDLLEADEPGCRAKIAQVVVAGNTTMSHLFTGLDPKSIRLAPYVPAAGEWPLVRAGELGLNLKKTAPVLIYPSVSSYVGGDIVAGVLASEMYARPELTLFIDVGTNGEIVVGNQDWMTCAACSAGPAFEGGGVKFGMRAAPGAIDQFYYDSFTNTHRLGVIGEENGQTKPIGICGSGLINIIAELFTAKVLDQQGKFVQSAAPALIREGEDGWEYLISPTDQNGLDRDIVLTEIDVENLIRAKGAMFSGYQTLLESVGLTMGDLERVIIGGGFGKSLNLRNAITIGLLPEMPVEKFTYIGNSSLTGATLALLSGELWAKAKEIKANMTNFELSDTPGYMDYYMSSQFLPHTQKDLFPETMARLAEKK